MQHSNFDVIVIGGGHNGLVAAAYLAKAGKRVVVLEQRPMVGGAAVTEEIFPGFKYSVFSYAVSLLRPAVIRDLDLIRHGLELLPLESTFTPLPDGDHLLVWDDPDRSREEIARHSARDAGRYEEFHAHMQRMARAVQPLLDQPAPDPFSFRPRDLLGLARLARHARGLGREDFHALTRLMSMSAADFLDEWFETEALKATKAASGIIGTFLGPRSPGTAYVLLHHYMGGIDGSFRTWGLPKGGTGAVSEAIATSARSFGAEIRTGAEVVRVLTRDGEAGNGRASGNGQAAGVALSSGEELRAPVVVSSLDPKRTFLGLFENGDLPGDFLDGVRRLRFRGSSGKVNLALAERPDFVSRPGDGPHLRGAISISPSVEYLERAYDDAKYGEFSRRPFLDIVIPSLSDPSVAPPGRHVMSIFVQYAPYHLNGGWDDARREAFGDVVVDTLAEYAPNLKGAILHRQVITPADIERTIGMTEGNIFHGELAPDQLFFFRPLPAWADYRTPIGGFYQCGSGTHPGGGIMGAPGRLAAEAILRDA